MARHLIFVIGTCFLVTVLFYSNGASVISQEKPRSLDEILNPRKESADSIVNEPEISRFDVPAEISDERYQNLFPEKGIRTHSSYVQFLKGKQVTLAFERPGLLTDIVLREGMKLTRGTMVAKLNDEAAQYTYQSAELEANNEVDLKFGEKSKVLAETEHKKAILSNENVSNTVVEIEVLRLKLAAEKASLQLEQAEHQKKVNGLTAQEAAAQLKTYIIKTPFDGTVVKIHKFPGEAVTQGDPIIDLVNIDKVRIRGLVNIGDHRRIKEGDRVNVKLRDVYDFTGSERILKGRLTMINLFLEDAIDQVEVWAEVENVDEILLPGMLAEMQIIPDSE